MRALVLDSWESTYRHCSALVRSVGRRATLPPDAIEDLCHQVLEKYLARAETLQGVKRDAWLVRVAQNATRDIYRSRLKARKIHSAFTFDETVIDIEDACVAQVLFERVARAIATLPEGQGHLIELAFLREFTHVEIAAMTRLPLGTVKTRIRSGLQRLRLMGELASLLEATGTSSPPSALRTKSG